MRFIRNGFFTLIIFDVKRIYNKSGLYEGNTCDKINFDSLLVLNRIFFIVFDSDLSINYFDNERKLSTMLTLLVIEWKLIGDKKVLRFDIDFSRIECF